MMRSPVLAGDNQYAQGPLVVNGQTIGANVQVAGVGIAKDDGAARAQHPVAIGFVPFRSRKLP